MKLILFDAPALKKQLLPFTFLRPVSQIRVGVLTLEEKWKERGFEVSGNLCEHYLQAKFPVPSTEGNVLLVNGACLPNEGLLRALSELSPKEMLVNEENELLAFYADAVPSQPEEIEHLVQGKEAVTLKGSKLLSHPWEVFQRNRVEIIVDVEVLTKTRMFQPLQDANTSVYGKDNLFLEEGAKVQASLINAEEGPVYIGKNATVHLGCMIQGAFALGEGAHLNMGAKIKGDSTIGPHCKVGGEVSNSVIFGYSNKGHDGFLGNSVLGEWCNLGADTNTSNLKNNYAAVKVWSYAGQQLETTGLQFCGLLMGDHSKSGINTMFNTGTVTGIAANIFDGGFPPKFVPSFSWGGAKGLEEYRLPKMYEASERMMSRRDVPLTDVDKAIMKAVFDSSQPHRERFHRN